MVCEGVGSREKRDLRLNWKCGTCDGVIIGVLVMGGALLVMVLR